MTKSSAQARPPPLNMAWLTWAEIRYLATRTRDPVFLISPRGTIPVRSVNPNSRSAICRDNSAAPRTRGKELCGTQTEAPSPPKTYGTDRGRTAFRIAMIDAAPTKFTSR